MMTTTMTTNDIADLLRDIQRTPGARAALLIDTGNGTIRKILRFTELVDANMIAEYVAHSQGRARIEVDMPESLMRKFQDRDRQRKHSAS